MTTVAHAAGWRVAPGSTQAPAISPPFQRSEPRWSLAFLGILSYLVMEYTRLAAMYPVLAPLQLGKVFVAIAVVGLLFAARVPVAVSSTTRAIDFGIALFVITSTVCALAAEFPEAAWSTLDDVLRWALIYFLISRIVVSSWRQRAFVFLLLLLNLKLSQFAVRSYFSARSFGRSEEFLSAHGVGAGSTGFFGNAGDFGVAMCVVWPIAGILMLAGMKKTWRWLLPVCFLVFSVAIFLCGSRGALVGVAAVGLAALVRKPQKLLVGVMILALLAGVFFILPDANKARFRSGLDWEGDSTASIRMNLWKGGLRMFLENPILGVGPGNFRDSFAAHYAVASEYPLDTIWAPHSIYIQALSELGMIGSLPLVLLVVVSFRQNGETRKVLERLRRPRKSFEYCMAFGLDLALIGYLGSGAFLTVLYYPHLWVLLGMGAGLNRAAHLLEAEPSPATEPARAQEWAMAAP